MKLSIESSKDRIKLIKQLAQTFGVMSKDPKTGHFRHIRLTMNPLICQRQMKKTIQKAHKVWQKLVIMASMDSKLMNRIYGGQISQNDEMIKNLLDIYNQAESKKLNRIVFGLVRSDYLIDKLTKQPKITEYNLQAVSMLAHSQKFHQIQRIVDQQLYNQESQQQNKNIPVKEYTENKPVDLFVQSLHRFYNERKLTGMILFIIQPNETNLLDIRSLAVQLMKKNHKVRLITFEEAQEQCEVKQNLDLYYSGVLVSIVYYRNGYRPCDYVSTKGGNQCWEAKRKLQLNNAIKIPSAALDLGNQKRLQVQISKEQIYKQYLSEEQGEILKKTLVKNYDFDEQSRQQQYLKEIESLGVQNFILKPNKEGGSNNIFGKQGFQMIKSMEPKQRKNYIMMQKITPQAVENIMISSEQAAIVSTVSEISEYGLIIWVDGKVVDNISEGYLIRNKPSNENQGGVMAGVGAIGSMMVVQ